MRTTRPALAIEAVSRLDYHVIQISERYLTHYAHGGFSMMLELALSANLYSMCGADDRIPSAIGAVGYAEAFNPEQNPGTCTVTLIGDNCAISAGHCLPVLGRVRFGENFGSSTNEYEVDERFVRALSTRIGNDWAVFRLLPNHITGKLPGQEYGFIRLETDATAPLPFQLNVTAIGVKDELESAPLTQFSASGQVLWDSERILYHDVDTGSGSSGAILIDEISGKGYAIHTHGGCDSMGNNKATIIGRVPNLIRAIRDCRSGLE
jgi:hypothetical protein